MNNLVIIGNGFDLAHNMETSYNHFIEYLVESHIKSMMFNDLLDFDGDFQSFEDFKDQKCPDFKTSGNGTFHTYIKLKLIKIIIEHVSSKKWSDIEAIYFKLLNATKLFTQFSDNPKGLNKQFSIIKDYLIDYLEIQEKNVHVINSYKNLFSLIDSKETAILNFNYTNTLKNIYSNEIKESKIIHIHGELSNDKNPIIFGYAANDEESRELIDRNDNEYMRNIKKHLYKRTENEKLLSYYLEGTEGIDVTILGHSCGLSDKLILNQILNHKNISSINVFYYEEYEQYFQTQVNIDRIMNRDEHFTKLVDFNSSHRMPQHNDTEEQQEAFIKYITPIIEKRKAIKRIYDADNGNAIK